MLCPTCGKVVDKRDPGAVLSHGNWNEHDKRFECFDHNGPIPCKSSKRKGDPFEWISIYLFFLN